MPEWIQLDNHPQLTTHTAVLDRWRNRVVSVGGWRVTRYPESRTWLWDGERWMKATTERRPPTVPDAWMAFDESRGRVLWSGGAPSPETRTTIWEWDGSEWHERKFDHGPHARDPLPMAWDPDRNRILALGYTRPPEPRLATWLFDGHTWQVHETRTTPGAGTQFAIAYDRTRGRAVCTTGGRTWEWAGGDWELADKTSGPTPSWWPPQLVFDEQQKAVVLLHRADGYEQPVTAWVWSGGAWLGSSSQGPTASDRWASAAAPGGGVLIDCWQREAAGGTWILDGLQWKHVRGPQQPDHAFPGKPLVHVLALRSERSGGLQLLRYDRGGHEPLELWQGTGGRWQLLERNRDRASGVYLAAARDEARDRIVALLHSDGYPSMPVLWEWDGSQWLRVLKLSWDPGLTSACWDPVGRQVVFSGTNPPNLFRWDGRSLTTWSVSPAPAWLEMVHDPIARKVVAVSMNTPKLYWTLERTGWTSVPAQVGARFGDALQFQLLVEPGSNRILLFAPSEDIQVWDGKGWSARIPKPPGRNIGTLMWDQRAGRFVAVMLTPSLNLPGSGMETFVLTSTAASAVVVGSDCGGSGAPFLRAFGAPRPAEGSLLELATTRAHAPAAFLLGAAGADLPLGPCRLRVDPAQPLFVVPALTDVHGLARLPLPIPYDLALRGLAVHTQALVEDPLVPFTRIATSAGLALRIGD